MLADQLSQVPLAELPTTLEAQRADEVAQQLTPFLPQPGQHPLEDQNDDGAYDPGDDQFADLRILSEVEPRVTGGRRRGAGGCGRGLHHAKAFDDATLLVRYSFCRQRSFLDAELSQQLHPEFNTCLG